MNQLRKAIKKYLRIKEVLSPFLRLLATKTPNDFTEREIIGSFLRKKDATFC